MGHEIYKLGRPFLVYHFFILSLSDLCLGVEQKIFKEIINFLLFTQKLPPLGVGVMNLTIIFFYTLPYRCNITKFGKDGPLVLENNMLTDNGRRTTDDNP